MKRTTDHLSQTDNIHTDFIRAAIWHGPLTEADAMLAAYPELATASIFTAAILGNANQVSRFLEADPSNATKTAPPYGGNALVYLCMSKYFRLKEELHHDFLEIARIFLEAGVDANSGFWTTGEYPEFETALYGAAGIAHDGVMTNLLLEFGADPNDEEAVYHSPEAYRNDAMKALVETGKISEDNLALMLIRKHDWHDYEGAKFLLEHGADPNRTWSTTSPFHHALSRSNHLAVIELLLNHGADPQISCNGITVAALAARVGRADVLSLLKKRNIPYRLNGVDLLIEACAFGNAEKVRELVSKSPEWVDELLAMGDELIAKFSISGNGTGAERLLALGIKADSPYRKGDGYWGIPKESLPIHVAAWLGYPNVVKVLINNGSPVDMPDQNGQTPLQLAVRASVDSYWTNRRTPLSVELLLNAGADANVVTLPTGYADIDVLLERKQRAI